MSSSLHVSTDEGSYPILINHGNWQQLADWLQAEQNPSCIILATDNTVGPLYREPLEQSLAASGLRTLRLECPAGEPSKSIEIATGWWQQLAGERVDRQAVVLALGGGVVGDLAGFVAATHLRGLRLVQVPTSLLAQVDSSVGGKVGINLPQGKNLVGSFWQPDLVWIDTDVLSTLPDREYSAGLAEVVKYAMISDADLFEWLEKNASAIMERQRTIISQVIHRCCEIKAEVVHQDTRETTGRRAILNYGHTVGHAIENLSGYGMILHGEAVAMGMVSEGNLAVQLGLCQSEIVQRLQQLLERFQLPTKMPRLDFESLMAAMKVDKKNTDSRIVFVLPTRIGQVTIENMAELQPHQLEPTRV